MKSISAWLAASVLVLGACGGSHVDPNPTFQPTESPPVANGPAGSASSGPVVGAYAPQDSSSSEIREEVAQAISLLQADRKDPNIGLVAIRSASTQVVAGTNYKFDLDVKTGKGPKHITVVVYKDASGTRRLSDVAGF
jgi:hypothetical protein